MYIRNSTTLTTPILNTPKTSRHERQLPGALLLMVAWLVIIVATLTPYRTEAQIPDFAPPRFDTLRHSIGFLTVAKTNGGYMFDAIYSQQPREYARIAGLWVGGVLGRDTLVSSAVDDTWLFGGNFGVFEMWGGVSDSISRKSSNLGDPFYSPDAKSELDLTAVYYDTLVDPRGTGVDFIDNRFHRPLNLRITETSYQWSFDFADDFVIFDYQITNIGTSDIKSAFVGVYYDGDVFFGTGGGLPAIIGGEQFTSGTNTDDVCGFLHSFRGNCGFDDTLNVAYIMDNDGDPIPPEFWNQPFSLRDVCGIRALRVPNEASQSNFNWWNFTFQAGQNFGPRKAGTPEFPFRDLNGFLGTPFGDRNKYHIMSNGEHDYNQITTALNHSAEGWLPPPGNALEISSGDDIRFMLSFGPFDIRAGESIHFTFALVGGENAHVEPTSFADNFSPFDPSRFLNTLDFSHFATNARWAGWVYDNPGVDSDGDGYFGKSRECVLGEKIIFDTTIVSIDSSVIPFDTTLQITQTIVPTETRRDFFEGDGIPDFRAASPPPAPQTYIITEPGKLTVRWNGFNSETTPDPITSLVDFEGYRVYTSLSNNNGDFELQTSYDFEDFNRLRFLPDAGSFELTDPPFSLEQLRALYGPNFDPLLYGIDNPLVFTDRATGKESTFYFTAQDWNQNSLNVPGSISKRFPNAPFPGIDPSEWTLDDLTKDGDPKFWEYEYVIDRLLESVPIWVAVTAFDYGSRTVGLSSLETNPLKNSQQAFPLTDADEFADKPLQVSVYPNPYRIDGNYRADGFEGRGSEALADERVRAINFINLPPKCEISIFSLDGDLVRQIIHDTRPGDPAAMHNSWDLISRNLQVVMSGIYYYVVETPEGRSQIGKFVIIM
jgi:hypothetical protein